MHHLEFSSLAFIDLSEIQYYTEITFGVLQKEIYKKKISDALIKIKIMPGRGRLHQAFGKEMRIFDVGSHIIIYTYSLKTIHIVRVVHQNMDLSHLKLEKG